MINIWYLILFFCLMPSLVYAQAKPKRDTSKDKSVIVAKKQKEETERTIIPVERKANYRKVLVAKQSKRKHLTSAGILLLAKICKLSDCE